MKKSNDIWQRIFEVGPDAGLSRANLYKMRVRGYVPPKHHSRVLVAAKERGIRISRSELEQTIQ